MVGAIDISGFTNLAGDAVTAIGGYATAMVGVAVAATGVAIVLRWIGRVRNKV